MTESVADTIHVLVVDDQATMRKIVKQLLHQSHLDLVSEAGNGIEALELISNDKLTPPDIIICDLHMDEMDGLEFVNQLRRKKNAVPVLILTGDHDRLLHDVTEQVGATKVLTKPISAPDLLQEIELAMGFTVH